MRTLNLTEFKVYSRGISSVLNLIKICSKWRTDSVGSYCVRDMHAFQEGVVMHKRVQYFTPALTFSCVTRCWSENTLYALQTWSTHVEVPQGTNIVYFLGIHINASVINVRCPRGDAGEIIPKLETNFTVVYCMVITTEVEDNKHVVL